jgi:hypothetical protein
MELGKTYRDTADRVKVAAENVNSGIAALTALGVLVLGVGILILLTDRQILKAVRANGNS